MNFCQQSDFLTKEQLDREIFKFTLSLYNNPLISRKAIDDIIKNFNNFIDSTFIPYIEGQIENERNSTSSLQCYDTAIFVLENSKNVFANYLSEYSRFKKYERESLYVPPTNFVIGEEPVYTPANDQTVKVENKKVYATYVSLQKTLRAVLQIPGVLDEILRYMDQLKRNTSSISNFVQGELWQSKYVPKNKGKIVFPLYVYFDDFECGNPLGSHAGEQKLGGLYASLACLPPHLKAKLENIYLLTICYSKHVKMFGNSAVFSKAIDELNVLSNEGLIINVDDREFHIYFECVLVLGDNLGVNSICGFSESFTATKYCRICSAPSNECREMIEERKCFVRTRDSYEKDFDESFNPLTGTYTASLTGIKERCVFNNINNFHIAENLSVDFMHDIPEGVACYSISKILQALIQDKIISLHTINMRIDSFPYGDLEQSNKPRPLQYTTGQKGGQKLKLKQSASEMLCLTRYLGLIIGDLIPPGNKHWKLYLYLRKLVGVLTSPALTKGEIHNLKDLIKKHNALYLELFGHLKPKMHMLIHYVTLMLLNGPVIHYSTTMYERKNKHLKEAAVGTTSSINLPFTIAIRHQLQLCYKKEFCSTMLSDIMLGPVNNINAVADLKKLIPNLSNNLKVITLKNVQIIGNKFCVGSIYLIRITEDGPQFGIIQEIFNCNDIFFYTKRFKTVTINNYYHSYEVINDDQPPLLVNIQSIPKFLPCLLIKKSIGTFIATRYDI